MELFRWPRARDSADLVGRCQSPDLSRSGPRGSCVFLHEKLPFGGFLGNVGHQSDLCGCCLLTLNCSLEIGSSD